MRKSVCILFIFIILIFAFEPVYAADYVVPKTMSRVLSSTFQGIGPGDRLLISAGNRGPLTIEGLRGEPGKPIVIVNSGGQVKIEAAWVGINLRDCEYLKLTGTGTQNITYGFFISDGSNIGVHRVGEKTDEIEIEYLEITRVKIGINAQTVKDINGDLVGREWTQYNTKIDHCYIHDVEEEGMYIGASNNEGIKPLLKGVYIHNNILTNVGFDGIQIGSATENVEVYQNMITDVGISDEGNPPKGANGKNGILINKYSTGNVYSNKIVNASRNGISAIGIGQYSFYNNIIINTGFSEFGGHGIAISSGDDFTINNNNIIKANNYGISVRTFKGTIFSNSVSDSGIADISAPFLPAKNIYDNKNGTNISIIMPPVNLILLD